MKTFIIESHGITRTRTKLRHKKEITFYGHEFKIYSGREIKTIKKSKLYKRKKVLKVYRGTGNNNDFFVRHFI